MADTTDWRNMPSEDPTVKVETDLGQVCGANEGPDADVDCLERALARRTTLLREVGEVLRVYACGAEDALLARIDAEVGDGT